MLYGSRKSRKKVFHFGDCRYAMQISSNNLIVFSTAHEATSLGYKQCPCCSRIPAEFKKLEANIACFCKKHNFKAFLSDDELYVISWDDTAWRICMVGDGTKQKQLLHESRKHVNYNRKKTPYHKREFHVQDIPSTSITGYLAYIRNHDIAEANRTKQKQKQAAIIDQVQSIKETQRRIAKQNRKRKSRGPAESNAQKRRRSNQHLREISRSFNDYLAARMAHI